MNNNGKLLLALLCGAAAGATLGLLFAPQKGERTRRQINDAAEDLTDLISRKANKIASRAEKLKDKVF